MKHNLPVKTIILTAVGLATMVSIAWLANSYYNYFISENKSQGSINEVIKIEDQQVGTTSSEEVQKRSTEESAYVKANPEIKPIIFSHAQMSYDASDVKELISNSNAIIIGKVVKRIENRGVDSDYTWPTFSIEVISALKGSPPETITMAQTELHYSGGRTYVVNGDLAWPKDVKEGEILLKEGGVYIFANSYSASKDLYGIGMAPYDRELITLDSSLQSSAVIDIAKRNSRVQEIMKAAEQLGVLNAEWK